MPDPAPPRDHGIPPPSRVALVTGASGGIGRALAAGLARAGLAVGLHGRHAGRLTDVLDEIAADGGRGHTVSADVSDYAAVDRAVAEVGRELGPVDLLVNNAGLIESVEVPMWEADPAEWRAILEADLLGPFHTVRAVVPGMVARGGGRVVDVSTGAALRDTDVYSAYGAAKTGLLRLGGALHAAGHARGVRAFAVAPGVVDTAMTRSMAVHSDRTEWTDPGDVVALVVAIAGGDLDAWSGRFLRAGADDVDSLRAAASDGLDLDARTLRLRPYGPADPLA